MELKFNIQTLKSKRLFFSVFVLFAVYLPLFSVSKAFAEPQEFRKRPSQASETKVEVSDVEAEVQFGRNIAARILGRYNLYDNEGLIKYINLVGKGVALQSNRPEVEYHFAILETDAVNAFAAPGGYIFLTKGAVDRMQDEAELAGVLAHEIAHITERHIVKELNIRGAEGSSGGLARLVGGVGDPARVAFFQAVDKAMEILFEKGLKVEDEFGADRVGTMLLANSGYDPSGLKRYLERIKDSKVDKTKVLSKTHPPFDERINRLDETIKTEGLEKLNYPTVKERFVENIKTK